MQIFKISPKTSLLRVLTARKISKGVWADIPTYGIKLPLGMETRSFPGWIHREMVRINSVSYKGPTCRAAGGAQNRPRVGGNESKAGKVGTHPRVLPQGMAGDEDGEPGAARSSRKHRRG